ncbi:MAG: SDR family oxidoreductase [Alphaproteobacteria bacterium]|nr:SDR family oxidoreductase [Alphaproteobacteria bacterium]
MSSLDLFNLNQKRCLITGSSRGIGFALATGLASAGAELVINGRNADTVAKAAAEIRATGATVYELIFDVTDHKASKTAIDKFEAETGAIDILINNAGMQHRAPLEEFPADAFDDLMRTNVYSIFNVGQACAVHMLKRGAGKIINIASIQTALARPSIAPYTASKGAVANFTKGMATDWGSRGLQINAIAPGYFKTELNQALVDDPEFSAWVAKRTPAGRWGNIEELVGAAIFLSSDASTYVNGITLYVDGGMSACV